MQRGKLGGQQPRAALAIVAGGVDRRTFNAPQRSQYFSSKEVASIEIPQYCKSGVVKTMSPAMRPMTISGHIRRARFSYDDLLAVI